MDIPHIEPIDPKPVEEGLAACKRMRAEFEAAGIKPEFHVRPVTEADVDGRVFVVVRRERHPDEWATCTTRLLTVFDSRAAAQWYIDHKAGWPDDCEISEWVVNGVYDETTGVCMGVVDHKE